MSTSSITNDMSSQTVGGTMAFLDWMVEKGYGTPAQVDPWRVALRKVLGTVEGEDFESLDWSTLDLDDYIARFQRLAGADYKAESIVAYARRVRNAFAAHRHYLDTGKPPAAKPAPKRQKAADKPGAEAPVVPIVSKQQPTGGSPGMVTFPYPLGDGQMISITIPPRLKPDDVNRITAFIRTLQDDGPERRQLPPSEAKAA